MTKHISWLKEFSNTFPHVSGPTNILLGTASSGQAIHCMSPQTNQLKKSCKTFNKMFTDIGNKLSLIHPHLSPSRFSPTTP
eukprot:1136415-Pelagomonas_calceolata.AAC.1